MLDTIRMLEEKEGKKLKLQAQREFSDLNGALQAVFGLCETMDQKAEVYNLFKSSIEAYFDKESSLKLGYCIALNYDKMIKVTGFIPRKLPRVMEEKVDKLKCMEDDRDLYKAKFEKEEGLFLKYREDLAKEQQAEKKKTEKEEKSNLGEKEVLKRSYLGKCNCGLCKIKKDKIKNRAEEGFGDILNMLGTLKKEDGIGNGLDLPDSFIKKHEEGKKNFEKNMELLSGFVADLEKKSRKKIPKTVVKIERIGFWETLFGKKPTKGGIV